MVVMRSSEAMPRRITSGSTFSKFGTSSPSSRSASQIFRQSLPRIADR